MRVCQVRVCQSGVLREVFGRKGKEVMEEDWRNFVIRSLLICSPHHIVSCR